MEGHPVCTSEALRARKIGEEPYRSPKGILDAAGDAPPSPIAWERPLIGSPVDKERIVIIRRGIGVALFGVLLHASVNCRQLALGKRTRCWLPLLLIRAENYVHIGLIVPVPEFKDVKRGADLDVTESQRIPVIPATIDLEG